MGLLDVVKGLLGDAADRKTAEPSMAEITIISTGAVTSSGESSSEPVSS